MSRKPEHNSLAWPRAAYTAYLGQDGASHAMSATTRAVLPTVGLCGASTLTPLGEPINPITGSAVVRAWPPGKIVFSLPARPLEVSCKDIETVTIEPCAECLRLTAACTPKETK